MNFWCGMFIRHFLVGITCWWWVSWSGVSIFHRIVEVSWCKCCRIIGVSEFIGALAPCSLLIGKGRDELKMKNKETLITSGSLCNYIKHPPEPRFSLNFVLSSHTDTKYTKCKHARPLFLEWYQTISKIRWTFLQQSPNLMVLMPLNHLSASLSTVIVSLVPLLQWKLGFLLYIKIVVNLPLFQFLATFCYILLQKLFVVVTSFTNFLVSGKYINKRMCWPYCWQTRRFFVVTEPNNPWKYSRYCTSITGGYFVICVSLEVSLTHPYLFWCNCASSPEDLLENITTGCKPGQHKQYFVHSM